jgi:hypothetical protein
MNDIAHGAPARNSEKNAGADLDALAAQIKETLGVTDDDDDARRARIIRNEAQKTARISVNDIATASYLEANLPPEVRLLLAPARNFRTR